MTLRSSMLNPYMATSAFALATMLLATSSAHARTLNSQTIPHGTSTPTSVLLCNDGTLFFNGKCRGEQFFRNRFVTPGSTLISLEGSRTLLADEGVIVVEAPNARTVRVRTVASTKHQAISVTKKYLDGYEVLSEFTITGWVDDDNYEHVVTTIEQTGSPYATVWWEHTARRYSQTWTWGTDYCYDDYGNAIPDCGPHITVASSSGTVTCEERGEYYGDTASGICNVALTGLYVGSAASTVAVLFSSGPAAAAGYASVAALGLAAGEQSCEMADTMWSAIGEALCEEPVIAPGTEGPPSLALVLESRAPTFGNDPCEELGGERYDGPPIVVGNGCSDASSQTGDGQLVDLPYADDDVLEVVVYGDSTTCDPGRVITASDNVCVVIH